MNRLSEVSLAVRRALPTTAITSTRRIMLSLAISSAIAVPALAQEAATGEPATVVVTGSRIPAPNLESTSPVQVVTAQEILQGGRMDISDVINQLPQNFNNGLGQDLGNNTSGLTTAGGVSTADLRGLGPNRTLVLVNGRRLGIGSPYTVIQSPAPNLDQIPTFLLERVDVMTGGASAVYGSDAIAGVINFITKQNFEGIQVDYHLGENFYRNDSTFVRNIARDAGYDVPSGTSTDGKTQTINVMAGTNIADGNGNITAYFSYHMADPVASADRDFGSCQLAYDADTDSPVCAGSSSSNYFQLLGQKDSAGKTIVQPVYSVKGSDFVLRGSTPTTPAALFNSQPFIFMSRDDRRYMAGFMGHVDINDNVKPYVEFHMMDDKTHQAIAPSALFRNSNPNDPTGSNSYNVNCSNPFLSAGQLTALKCSATDVLNDQAAIANGGTLVTRNIDIGRRNVEGGGRTSDYNHTAYRGVGGIRGSLIPGWSYDAYGQYYTVDFFNRNSKYLDFGRIDNSLLVTGTAANPVCVSGGSCVPYNIFKDGGVTPEAVNYLSLDGTARGTSTLKTIHADFTGDLGEYGIKLPTAGDPVGVNFGYERRQENLQFAPDSAEQSGQLAGFGGAPVAIDKSQTVNEGFIEVRAPLLQDKPFVKDLTFDTGFRTSDYSVTGKINTHKFELQYAPVADMRFRGSFQRAIRAPSLIELFNPQQVGLIAFSTDPCGGTAPARSAADCARTGVTPQLYGSIPQIVANQVSQLAGGNPGLQAENSNSYTIGVTFTPTFLSGFTGSLDYYNIKIKNGIGTYPAAVLVQNCLNTGDPLSCSQIVRNPTTGGLSGATIAGGGYIIQTAVNVASSLTRGIDAQANYRLPLDKFGDLSFTLNGAYLLSQKTTPAPGIDEYDCAGLFGFTCQTVSPEWRHIVRTTWTTPWANLAVSLNWRYIGKVSLDNNDSNPTLHFASFDQFNGFNARIPAYNYLDISGSWGFREGMDLRFGVNNIADKNPPIITSDITAGGDANTYSTYDQMGRQAFIAVSMKF